ncbi:hypothetical protein SAMN05421821_106107 [Mucilaginibacter lappiensis]|uniref:Uncharacterized protein n=1 Tax=Mucilaginibacter lappiensis TaxID=354630 RepID=A0ABR6PKK1_9SPHI|nr:hypothetical protein [Mucilaginibacter lappiensis]MBB6110299.1 hypothetical protein [Mucilaginibacter lappiensis]SIR29673.1 hypothetical protein SAMN05421821_106107 [Mucilaginibacter lappiensis]
MIRKLLLGVIVTLLSFITKQTLGQTSSADTSEQRIAMVHIADAYNTAIGQQSRLYNGPEYELYNPNIKGNAYFQDVNKFSPGTVNYDGLFFKDVPMMYDLNKDVVVVLLYNKFSMYTLLNERLEHFDLFSHHFVNIIADSLQTNAGINAGFYDELYHGNVVVLAKYSKSLQTTSISNTIDTYFSSSKSFFLKKGNNYYSISGQAALLDILKDKKKELQQYIKANKIKYRRAPEEAMVAIAGRYDELSR